MICEGVSFFYFNFYIYIWRIDLRFLYNDYPMQYVIVSHIDGCTMGCSMGGTIPRYNFLGYKERNFGRSVRNTYLSTARIYTYEDTDISRSETGVGTLIFLRASKFLNRSTNLSLLLAPRHLGNMSGIFVLVLYWCYSKFIQPPEVKGVVSRAREFYRKRHLILSIMFTIHW